MTGWLMRALARPLEVRTDGSGDGPFDAIVALGAPLRTDGSLSDVVEERVQTAVALWRRGVAPIVCMCGGATRGSRVAEAEVMGGRAVELGVPAATLVIEARSMTTLENAREASKLLKGRRILLVSQPFHLRRGRYWFRRHGFDVTPHWIADSVQYAMPRRAARWVLREYGAWVYDVVIRGDRRGG